MLLLLFLLLVVVVVVVAAKLLIQLQPIFVLAQNIIFHYCCIVSVAI